MTKPDGSSKTITRSIYEDDHNVVLTWLSSHHWAKATELEGGIGKHNEMLHENHTPEDCAIVLRVFAKVHDENCCDADRLALSLSTKRAASAVKESRNASLHPAPPAPRS